MKREMESQLEEANKNLGENYSTWKSLCCLGNLSESFIRKFKDNVFWPFVCRYQTLSEDFIREFKDLVSWRDVSISQYLSESFIREFKDDVYWYFISANQRLSESFISEFEDLVVWEQISKYQKLSEDFIRKFSDKVEWLYISMLQNLSESFIESFNHKVSWEQISKYQKLSEKFICKNKDFVNWYNVSRYQKLSKPFIGTGNGLFEMKEINDSWNYKSVDFKKDIVFNTRLYTCLDDYFIGYKNIRNDRYSHFNFQFKYEKGNTYETFCDCTDNENSFGFSVWTEKKAKNYHENGLIVRCKVNYEDVGRVVHNGGKIRCSKIEILD